jgi:hypothetical protein
MSTDQENWQVGYSRNPEEIGKIIFVKKHTLPRKEKK